MGIAKPIKTLPVIIIGVVLGIYCFGRIGRITPLATNDQLNNLLNNMFSVEYDIEALTPNNSENTLAYIRATGDGKMLFLLDLKSLAQSKLTTTNQAARIYEWSPDDRFLAFSEAAPDHLDEEHIAIYDTKKHSLKRLTNSKGLAETSFHWIGTNRYYFAFKSLKSGQIVDRYVGTWPDGNYSSVTTWLGETFVPVSDHIAAFSYLGNLHECPMDSTNFPPVTNVSAFPPDDDDSNMRWLRYNPTAQIFMFCSHPKGSTWRYLYKYNSANSNLTQLTDEDTYNGQWLGNSDGYAFVGNRDNHFYMALRPEDVSLATNLFVDGSVANYTAGKSGNTVYVTAAQDIEPQGIWEYNLTNRNLRCLVPGTTNGYVLDHLVAPAENKLESEDGVTITYLVYPPVTTNAISKRIGEIKRHMLYIVLPPPTSQAQKVWAVHIQIEANLGFEVAAINYRGCDGYGRDFSKMIYDRVGQTEDVLNIYNELIKDPTIDSNNVIVQSSSAATGLSYELLMENPKLWSGVVFDHPAPFTYDQLDSHALPPILMTTGDQDSALPFTRQMNKWAYSNGVKMKLVILHNSGHVTWSLDELKKAEIQGMKFDFSSKKP